METSFCVATVILLALFFMLLHGNNPALQLPGQPSAMLPGKTSAPAVSAGLSVSPGIPQRDLK